MSTNNVTTFQSLGILDAEAELSSEAEATLNGLSPEQMAAMVELGLDKSETLGIDIGGVTFVP